MTEIVGTLYSIAWGSPYTEPPDGAPRVLAEYFIPGHAVHPPEAIQTFPHTLGGGYGLSIAHLSPPIRRQSPEALASLRQKRLRRRLERQAPMFADQLYTQEVARKEAYYVKGITDANLEEAREQEEAAYAERLAVLQARADRLIVYAAEPLACAERGRQLQEEMRAARVRAKSRKRGDLCHEPLSPVARALLDNSDARGALPPMLSNKPWKSRCR